jgi:hypothetical protein
MSHTYKLTNELFHCVLRIPKDESYFLYFTFESHEGLCFYSTVDDSLKGQYRDIDVKCAIESKTDLLNLLAKLQETIRLDILLAETIQDS